MTERNLSFLQEGERRKERDEGLRREQNRGKGEKTLKQIQVVQSVEYVHTCEVCSAHLQ